MKPLLSLALLVLLCSCASYDHSSVLPDGRKEQTHVGTLFMTSKASKVNSVVSETNADKSSYKRTVGVSEVQGAGDSAFVLAIFQAGVETGKKMTVP